MHQTTFKTCSGCGKNWLTQNKFLEDIDLKLNGYKADFEKLEYGLLFFTHDQENCHSTLAIEVVEFMNLHTGPIHPLRRTGLSDCPGYCRDTEQLARCEAVCECAFVRDIIHVIKQRKIV